MGWTANICCVLLVAGWYPKVSDSTAFAEQSLPLARSRTGSTIALAERRSPHPACPTGQYRSRCSGTSAGSCSTCESCLVRALDACSEVSSPERTPGRGQEAQIASKTLPAAFTLDFGKHRGKLLSEVAPEYISWMIRTGIHKSRPGLFAALRDSGELNAEQQKRPARQQGHRQQDEKDLKPRQSRLPEQGNLNWHLSYVSVAQEPTTDDGEKVTAPTAPEAPEQKTIPISSTNSSGRGGKRSQTAWQSAAAHVGKLRRTTMPNYFARVGQVKSLTGVHTWTGALDPAGRLPTPSPRRARAAGRMRDELSWIRSLIGTALQDATPTMRAVVRASQLVPRFVRPLPAGTAEYTDRLAAELVLINDLGFEECFLQVPPSNPATSF